MGGLGSGNWYRWQPRKTTVEECLALPTTHLKRHISAGGGAGMVTWTLASGGKATINIYLAGTGENRIIVLGYRWRGIETVVTRVSLATTPTQFGSPRWWYRCPIVEGRVECNRRVGKLYLPPGAKHFGCRRCHDLTYRSCQESHQTERLIQRWGMMFADDNMIV
jgi:hypothetical protein